MDVPIRYKHKEVSWYVADRVALKNLINETTPVDVLSQLSRYIGIAEPLYEVKPNSDGLFGSVVFGGKRIISPQTWIGENDAINDVALLAYSYYTRYPSEFPRSDGIQSVPLTSAFDELCKVIGLEPDIKVEQLRGKRKWICVYGISKHGIYYDFDNTPEYDDRRRAFLHAVVTMYEWLTDPRKW